MPHRHWFRQRIVAAAGSTGTDDLTFGPVQHDRHYHLTRFAVEDETSAPSTDIRVFVTGHGYNHLLLEQNSPAAATLYWDDQGTFLSQGESLVSRFVGATAKISLRQDGDAPGTRHNFQGILVNLDTAPDVIGIDVGGIVHRFALDDIKTARLVPD